MPVCKKLPPHIGKNGRIARHANQKECDEWGGATGGKLPQPRPIVESAPAPSPTVPVAPVPAGTPPNAPAQTLGQRLFAWGKEIAGGPNPNAPPQTIQAPVEVAPQWEATDELMGRFVDAALGIVKMVIRGLETIFKFKKRLEDKGERSGIHPLDLNVSDRSLMAAFLKKPVTGALKQLGVDSLEEFEAIVNMMGGGRVIVAIGLTLVGHFVEEWPKSGFVEEMNARAKAAGGTMVVENRARVPDLTAPALAAGATA